ncbi:MAG: metallophosphoesterase family protein [Muribaculaceae bacterium]
MRTLVLGAAMAIATAITPAAAQQLKFGTDGQFKIVQLTDVHWNPSKQSSELAEENIINALDAERPDLVVITGDVIFGTPAKTCIDRTLKPIIDRKIPFAVTFGNHDAECDWSAKQIYDYLCTQPGNLTASTAGLSGITNYTLAINSGKDAGSVAAVLYVLDSHQYSQQPDLTNGYDWIKFDQIDWYRSQSEKFKAANGGKPMPALAFMHIPVPEYTEAARDPGTLLIGTRKEEPCCPKINTGLYSAMLLQRDVMGMFVGHDHVNDYICDWKGIALAYGRYSGGHTVYHDIQGDNGARVIVLTEGSRSFRTWIRLRIGNKVINEVSYPDDFLRPKED